MSKNRKSKLPIKPIPKPIPKPRISCPDPGYVLIDRKNAYFDPSEFNASQLSNSHGNFNSNHINKKFLHTIIWKPKRKCCQVIKARLVIKFRANQDGHSLTSSDAGNDSVSLVKNGGINIIPSEKIYNNHSFSVGNTTTKSWSLSGSQLNCLNLTKKLSIYVQDDTAVTSIKLKLWVCCLSPVKSEKPRKK